METRIKKVVLDYDFDSIMNYHWPTLNGETMKAADALRKEKPVMEWYRCAYPDDSMGGKIDGSLTWDVLLDRMRQGKEAYGVIGVGDSVIRERIFGHLAELMVVPYEVVYRLWLRDEGDVTWGSYEGGECRGGEVFVSFKREAMSNAFNLEAMIGRLTKEELEQVKCLASARLRRKPVLGTYNW